MTFSDRFLAALGGWQRGWREERDRRIALAKELIAAADDEGLAPRFRTSNAVCYRKRYLVPNNPENGGDLGPLFLNGFIDEGLASWTTDEKFAQVFKDPLREGTFSAVFAHTPLPGEVLVNIPELWADRAFQESVKTFADRSGNNADALLYFKFRQSEVVMDAKLDFDEVYSLCGKSSPFDVLCELAGLRTDDERDEFWRQLVEADTFPEDARWLSEDATRAILQRTRRKFLDEHGQTIANAIGRAAARDDKE